MVNNVVQKEICELLCGREFIDIVEKFCWYAILFVRSECYYYFVDNESQEAWTLQETDLLLMGLNIDKMQLFLQSYWLIRTVSLPRCVSFLCEGCR